jgi:CBS domain-containing protein
LPTPGKGLWITCPMSDVEMPSMSTDTEGTATDNVTKQEATMSSLVHLGRAAMPRAELQAPHERMAVRGDLIPAERGSRRARTAADVMTRLPVTVHRSASMWTAWDRLRATDNRHLVVVDDHQRPVGVVDDRTIALEWPPGPMGAHRTPVHSLLRGAGRPRVHGADDVSAVARTMLGARVDAVPVVDREGRLFGLITLWHLAELAAAQPTGSA